MKVEHKDKQIYNTLTGEKEDLENNIKIINEENPIEDNKIISQATKNNEETDKQVIDETGKESQVLAESAKNLETKDKEVKKGAVLIQSKAEDIANLKDMVPEQEREKQQKEKIEQAKSQAKIQTSKTEGGGNKTKIVFNTPKIIEPSMQTAKKQEKPVTGNFYVQIGAYASNAEAEKSWTTANTKISGFTKGSTKKIMQAKVNNKTYYRLSFGPFKVRADANNKCTQVKAKGINCIVQSY
jgi:cell division protein FtsN